MKKFFKFIPAALAVLALASCSNDELLGEKAQQAQDVANKGDLRLSWDAFDNEGGTRAMRNNNFGKLTFENGDQVNVYSDDLYKTDWYTFQDDAFYYDSEGEKMVDNPKFGVMPGETVRKAYIDRATRTTRVDIEIPDLIEYGSDQEAKIDGTDMYACNLPAFGYASLNEAGYVEVKNLRYMVGILKIDLEKAVSNASYLRLINYGQGAVDANGNGEFQHGADYSELDWNTAKPLSGQLTAALAADEADRKEVKLEVLDETLPTAPYLYVDLRHVASNTSCIYIPVVPGLDGDLDNIRVEYTRNRNDFPQGFNAIDWAPVPGMKFAGKEFKQHSRYTGSWEFEFADMSPKLVSDILDQYQTTANDIDIDITNSFTIDAGDPAVDQVIYLPAFENDVNVNITLDATFAAWANANPDQLVITDADPTDPFTGTITININGKGGAIAANAADMQINLAEGKAVIVGAFTNGSDLTLTSGNIEIGDGTDATSGLTWTWGIGDDIQSIKIAENATIAQDIDCSNAANLTKSIIVAGSLTGDIAASPAPTKDEKSTVTISGDVTGNITAVGGIFTDVNISGAVTGDITLDEAVKGKLTITSGDATDANAKFVTGNVTTKGDVEIALTAEGEAIAGTLEMVGAAKTLTLKQGYVNTIKVNVLNAGGWEDKYINVNLDDENQGNVAFLTLTEVANQGVAKFSESVWNGKKITNATYKDKFTTDTKSGETTRIYTASQLASFNGIGSDCTLNNNIDLNDKAWEGYAQKGTFEGAKVVDQDAADDAYPTIKNLNLKKDQATETNYANGLFTNNTGASTVKNLTLNGVEGVFAVAKDKGIGAIFATATNAVTISDVKIYSFDISNTAAMTGVGSLVGIAKATVTASKVYVDGTIDGYSSLGGFVGTTNSGASFTDCDASSITFQQTYTSSKAMDIDYAKIGGFVGNVSASVAVTITGGKAPESINYDKPSKMYVSDTSAGTGNFYTYEPRQTFIGFSGNANNTIAAKIGASSINGAGYCADALFGTSEAAGNNGDTHGTTPYTFLYTWPAK